jgi:uncharacterized protein (TIGR04255 family)
MNAIGEFKIDMAKDYPHLRNAPIVEAVIGIQARAEGPWEAATVLQQIRERLPEYSEGFAHSRIVRKTKLDQSNALQTTTKDLGWIGFRIHSEDKLHTALFNRDGFVFSRLRPYETWENFKQETMRLWQIYVELAKPEEVQGIKLRYINRIELPPMDTHFEDYLQSAPKPPKDMPLPYLSFLYQDMLAVPGHDYAINIIRTIQPPQDPVKQGMGLILDTTVATIQPFEVRQEALNKRLPEMRWLKNEVFFGSVTEKAINSFK